jgi:20S proteasome alpha/beta subunit
MTIVAGIPSTNWVVLGADSEEGTSLTKSSVRKIERFESPAFRALIAGAGSGDFIDLAVQEIAGAITPHPSLTLKEVRSTMERVVTEIHENRIDRYPRPERPSLEFELLAAVWVPSGIQLLKIARHLSIIEKGPVTIGAGSHLARYLLSTFALPTAQASAAQAIRLTAYLLQQVKKHAAFCGGQSQIVYLDEHKTEEITAATIGSQEVGASLVMEAGAKLLLYLTDPYNFGWDMQRIREGVDQAAEHMKIALAAAFQPPALVMPDPAAKESASLPNDSIERALPPSPPTDAVR